MLTRLLCVLSTLGLASACLSKPIDQPARLSNVDDVTLAKVTEILRQALSKQNVALGPMTLDSSTVTLLPPPLGPYETRSTVVPEYFDIVKRGHTCVLVRRALPTSIELPGVTCIALAK